jgi:tRNA threonylcarbamoyladenosine biosynthesis protein TsaB
VAVAQGLAFGARLSVAAVTTLEALALQVLPAAGQALACLDARMGEVYWARFAAHPAAGLIELGASQVGTPESVAIEPGSLYAAVGRGFSAYPALTRLPGVTFSAPHTNALPNAREIARLGALRLAAGQGIDPAALMPLYLRDKVALTEAERGAR